MDAKIVRNRLIDVIDCTDFDDFDNRNRPTLVADTTGEAPHQFRINCEGKNYLITVTPLIQNDKETT